MGATFGILEYLSQSNSNSDCVPLRDRFKFIDDLTTLEIINLLAIGLSSYNIKAHIPSNIGTEQLYVSKNNLKTQDYLNKINDWTKNQMMHINENKTKAMVFNFTKKFQFTTNLELNSKLIEIETENKLLGTIISNKLTWDLNIKNIVKKANSRMQLLHQINKFGASKDDMMTIYFSYVRSILEQSCNVWHTSLTDDNEQDLERVQKSALKIILGKKYIDYESACNELNITDLKTRRQNLFEKFTIQNINHPLMREYFKEKFDKKYNIRQPRKYEITKTRTERFNKSAIIQMQQTANDLYKKGKIT